MGRTNTRIAPDDGKYQHAPIAPYNVYSAFDANGDGEVGKDEVNAVINNYLGDSPTYTKSQVLLAIERYQNH